MKYLRHLLAAALIAAFPAFYAHAQNGATVVSQCGQPPIGYTVGQAYPPTMDTNGNLCPGLGYGETVSISSAAISAPGTLYVPGTDAGTVNGGSYSTDAALSITDTQLVAASVTPSHGGTSCTTGSGKILTGTTGTGTKFQVSATAAGGAVVSIQSITVPGDYTANPSSLTAEPVSGDSCSGTELALTMGALKATVSTAGTYQVPPSNPASLTSTAGSGVGSTWNLTESAPSQGSVTSNDGGTKITAASMPSGGVGLTGWLSAIWYELQGAILTELQTLATQLGTLAYDGSGYLEVNVKALPTIVLPTPTHAQTTVLASNLVVKNSAGSLYGLNVSADSTLSGAAWWIMVFDATSLPADGTVTPAKCIAQPVGATAYTGAFPNPIAFATGIVIGVSTNGCFTKAASTHAFIGADYQ